MPSARDFWTALVAAVALIALAMLAGNFLFH